MNITGKNVVITGATSGIGNELLGLFLQAGCRVVAAGRNLGKVSQQHPNLYLKKCDVSSPKDIDRLFDFSLNQLGSLDIFIANAGFTYYEKIDRADWSHIQKIFDTNAIGVFYSAIKMQEACRKDPYHFVCTSSAMGLLPLPGYALYSSTKAAVKGFASSYRHHLRPGQYFQVVYPIATKTRFFSRARIGTVPGPMQSPHAVAITMVDGIRKNRNDIFPSRGFWFVQKYFPFLLRFFVYKQKKNWQKDLGV